MAILFRYLHFLSLIVFCGTLLAENFLLQKSLKRWEIARFAKVDGLYGLSAMCTLFFGLMLLFKYGNGLAFYLRNPVFHAKLTLFVLVGLLSIAPTIFFIKQRKGPAEEEVAIPGKIRALVRLELAIALCIPLLAAIMARGIGFR
jgi:putative membrane protein